MFKKQFALICLLVFVLGLIGCQTGKATAEISNIDWGYPPGVFFSAKVDVTNLSSEVFKGRLKSKDLNGNIDCTVYFEAVDVRTINISIPSNRCVIELYDQSGILIDRELIHWVPDGHITDININDYSFINTAENGGWFRITTHNTEYVFVKAGQEITFGKLEDDNHLIFEKFDEEWIFIEEIFAIPEVTIYCDDPQLTSGVVVKNNGNSEGYWRYKIQKFLTTTYEQSPLNNGSTAEILISEPKPYTLIIESLQDGIWVETDRKYYSADSKDPGLD